MQKRFQLTTNHRDEFLEITDTVRAFIRETNLAEGYALIYCPHTTAGITINENADPDVVRDMLMRLNEVYPWEHPQDRHAEGNTAAHLKASTVGSSQTVIIHRGQLVLGTWQGIYFCEFDGPRTRSYIVKLVRTES